MSVDDFMKDCDSVDNLTPASLIKLARHYFPATLANSVKPICDGCLTHECPNDGENHTVLYAKRLTQQLKHYVSPQSMADDMQTFRSFAGSSEILGLEICEGYSTHGLVYKTLKGEMFVLRQDVFVYVQNMVIEQFKELKNPTPATCLGLFLKLHEAKIGGGTLEYLMWNTGITSMIEEEFLSAAGKSIKEKFPELDYTSTTVDEALQKFQKLIPGEWDEQRYKPLENLVRRGRSKTVDANQDYLELCAPIIRSIKSLMDVMDGHGMEETTVDPKFVRLFVDNHSGKEQKFMMVEELEALEGLELPERDPMANWETIESNKGMARIMGLEDSKLVKTIIVPIIRTKLRAVPIRTAGPGFKYCKLAIDVFFELLRDLIFGLKVFQKGPSNRDLIVEFLSKIHEHFPITSEKNTPYFIPGAKIEELRAMTLAHFASIEDVAVETLDLEGRSKIRKTIWYLEALKIPETLPDIEHLSLMMDLYTSKTKKEMAYQEVLEMIGDCIIAQLLYDYQPLEQFVHNQNGCDRVLYTHCCGKGKLFAVEQDGDRINDGRGRIEALGMYYAWMEDRRNEKNLKK